MFLDAILLVDGQECSLYGVKGGESLGTGRIRDTEYLEDGGNKDRILTEKIIREQRNGSKKKKNHGKESRTGREEKKSQTLI